MKHLILTAILFAAAYGLNYLIIQADPQMNFEQVHDKVAYGSMMFAGLIGSLSFLLNYEPKKVRR